MRYPVQLKLQEVGNYAVSCPDLPEALTLGDTEEEALRHAADALETALDFYFEHNRCIPLPSPPRRAAVGRAFAQRLRQGPPLQRTASQRVRPSGLAKGLAIPRQRVTRLLGPRHSTKIDSIASALKALGKTLEVLIV